MIETNDGWYVVKWRQNPQHPRVLINEVAGAELLRRLGIATPEWAMVEVDAAFLNANPQAVISMHDRFVPVRPGWHFGSRVPVNPETRSIYDALTIRLLNRISNIDDFLRVFAFDHWTDNCDGRQAIFFCTPKTGFSAQMIDQGFAFGFDGAEWRMRDRPVGKQYSSMTHLYRSHYANHCLEEVIAKIQNLSRNGLDEVRRCIPSEWAGSDGRAIDMMFEDLCRRSRRLPDMLTAALAIIRAG